MEREQLKRELKALIVAECEKKVPPESIGDAEPIMGDGSRLGLDSLDALQISLAVQQRYGRRIEGGPDTRHAFASVDALADFILG